MTVLTMTVGLPEVSCLLLLLLSRVQSETVSTKSGAVIGSEHQFLGLHRNGTYHSFQGIPYAQPPLGSLRFRDPVEVAAWEQPLSRLG